MSFIRELKERNVVKVALIYIVTAWVLAQVADLALPAFDAPPWVLRVFLFFLLMGFPVSLIMAWALELTPEGIKRAETSVGEKRMWTFSIALVVATITWFGLDMPTNGTTGDTAHPKSIAVLPFVDLSPEQDQEWFTDGLTEEVLNSLARAPDLLVSSRTSSFSYKNSGKPLTTIAAELGVAHVLEGSVRRVGDNIRVTAQLIRAHDGFHVWSENMDGDANDVIRIQERVATEIATAMNTAMDADALAEMMRTGTRSVRAYELYLRARAMLDAAGQQGNKDFYIESVDLLRQAIAEDPAYSSAWRDLAAYWGFAMDLTRMPSEYIKESMEERRANFEAAMTMAIKHARHPADRSYLEFERALRIGKWREALASLRVFIEARPNLPENCGRLVDFAPRLSSREVALEAAALCSQQLESGLDPFHSVAPLAMLEHRTQVEGYTVPLYEKFRSEIRESLIASYQFHRGLLWVGEVEAARELLPLLVSPRNENRFLPLMRQACAEGRRADAEAAFAEFRESPRAESVSTQWLAHMMLGNVDEAEALLRRFDTPDTALVLGSWLSYPQFDARPYPHLMDILERNQVNRPPPRPEPFRCPPAEGVGP